MFAIVKTQTTIYHFHHLWLSSTPVPCVTWMYLPDPEVCLPTTEVFLFYFVPQTGGWDVRGYLREPCLVSDVSCQGRLLVAPLSRTSLCTSLRSDAKASISPRWVVPPAQTRHRCYAGKRLVPVFIHRDYFKVYVCDMHARVSPNCSFFSSTYAVESWRLGESCSSERSFAPVAAGMVLDRNINPCFL